MRAYRPRRSMWIVAAFVLVLPGWATLLWSAAPSPRVPPLLASAAQAHEAAAGSAPSGFDKIQHILFVVKENRTFDNYFGTFPGADGATRGTISTGRVMPLGHTPDRTGHDIGHSWRDAILAIDGGKMDKFDLIAGGNIREEYLAYTQLTERDLPNYFAYARTFVLADRMFSSLTGPSFPNHLYTVGAQSGGAINNPNKSRGTWGCDSDEGSTVPVMDTRGVVTQQFPCFDFQTLADTLEHAGVTWKYYCTASKRFSGFLAMAAHDSAVYAA